MGKWHKGSAKPKGFKRIHTHIHKNITVVKGNACQIEGVKFYCRANEMLQILATQNVAYFAALTLFLCTLHAHCCCKIILMISLR